MLSWFMQTRMLYIKEHYITKLTWRESLRPEGTSSFMLMQSSSIHFWRSCNTRNKQKVKTFIKRYKQINKLNKSIESLFSLNYLILLIKFLFLFVHLLTNSERLLNNVSWLENLIISSFSFKQSLQELLLGLL